MTVLSKTPFQLFLTLICAVLFSFYVPVKYMSFFLALSMTFKSVLLFILPIVIFFYLSYALASFQKSAPLLIFVTVFCIVISNATTVMTVYGLSHFLLPYLCTPLHQGIGCCNDPLTPLFTFVFPVVLPNNITMVIAALTGLIVGIFNLKNALSFLERGRDHATHILKKFFIPLLPLYVLGFVFKISHDGDLLFLFENYARIFFFSVFLLCSYVFVMYLMASGFSFQNTLTNMKHMLPAGLMGFSTMSSATAMPITLTGVRENLRRMNDQTHFERFIVPISTNIHLIGDGISIALTALALLYISGAPQPDVQTYCIFTFWYCMAKFSTAGIPGAGVMVILPVMQQYLSLTPEMTSILATIYILKDSILTATNVMGNGAFSLIIFRLVRSVRLIQNVNHSQGDRNDV